MMTFAFAWSQIRAYPARLLAVVVAVVLATGFLAATAAFASTAETGLRLTAAAPLSRADIVVDNASKNATRTWFRELAHRPNVAAVDPQYARTIDAASDHKRGSGNVQSIPRTADARWFSLSRGRWPHGGDELVADQKTLDALGITVGDAVSVTYRDEPARALRIVGAADLGFQPLTGSVYRFYADPDFFVGDTATLALLRVEDRSGIRPTVSALNASLPSNLMASSAADQAAEAAARFAGGASQLTFILLAFAAIALLASIMVVANTFQVLVVQRARQVALLRLVGAHKRQVRNVVLAEASLLGGAGAVLGVLAGVGLGYVGASALSLAGGGLQLSPAALAGCFVVGVFVTVGAAWMPARRATSVAPVDALGASVDSATTAPRGRVAFLAGLTLIVLGATGMAVSVPAASLPLALLAGVLCAAGLLMSLRRVIATLLPGIERVLSGFGVSAELAGSNLRRNPQRTVSAMMAVVLGAALITALGVAARSGQSTVDADLDARYPIDVSVHTDDMSVSTATFDAIKALPQLTTAERIPTTFAALTPAGSKAPTRVAGLPREMVDAVAPALDHAANQPVILLPEAYLQEKGITDGDRITVTVNGKAHEFMAYASKIADSTGQSIGIVNEQDFAALDGPRHLTAVWALATQGADLDDLQDALASIAAADPGIEVGGALDERGDIANTLSILVNLSLAMLLITVLIALLGITNILSLSVIERTREIALLRALGTRRGRIRTALGIESVVLTATGALIGIAIGVPVGLVGVSTVVGKTASTVIDLPLAQLVTILVAAAVTGVIASLAPTRRATRIAPAQGLIRP